MTPTLADLDYADAFGYLANRLQNFQQNIRYYHTTAKKNLNIFWPNAISKELLYRTGIWRTKQKWDQQRGIHIVLFYVIMWYIHFNWVLIEITKTTIRGSCVNEPHFPSNCINSFG